MERSKIMEIDIKNIKAAYETATESEKKERPVTERIKTFEDAVHALGESHPFVVEWRIDDNLSPDLEAYLKLRIICAALNEGWEQKFNVDDFCYSPWFQLYTKEEYEELDENEKKESRVVYRSNNYAYAYGGVSFAHSNHGSTYVRMSIGFRLVLKTKKLAEYCGKQFIDIWADYML